MAGNVRQTARHHVKTTLATGDGMGAQDNFARLKLRSRPYGSAGLVNAFLRHERIGRRSDLLNQFFTSLNVKRVAVNGSKIRAWKRRQTNGCRKTAGRNPNLEFSGLWRRPV